MLLYSKLWSIKELIELSDCKMLQKQNYSVWKVKYYNFFGNL